MKLSLAFLALAVADTDIVSWWSSFDNKGWSTCSKGSNGFRYMNGIYRNHCNKLYCIEQVDCRTTPTGNGGNSCYDASWWSSFDRKGWSTCKDGSYISGLYRNSCDSLYCLEQAKCCKQTNTQNGIAKSQSWGDCYNHNWWGSFDNKGWSRCNSDYFITGLFRNHCNDLYCLEEAKCCKPKDVHPNQVVANWWSSFDNKGWSMCTKHGNGYKYMDALYRNHCNKLYCIEEARCSTSVHHDDEQKCTNGNWWGSFDKKGWSTCPEGSFITGLYRNTCSELYCLEQAKCCTSKVRQEKWVGCYNANWWGSFDNKGWSGCNPGFHMAGLYRNNCNDLYCIEMAKCCKSNLEMAPVDCEGSWGKWSTCSKSCNGGERARKFHISRNAAHGGKQCSAAHFDVESEACNTMECPETVDVELTIDETKQSFTNAKKNALRNKIADALGLTAAEVEITVGSKPNPISRRLMAAAKLLITVTIKVRPSQATVAVNKMESDRFTAMTGAKFVAFKPSHGSSICATCKWDGHHIAVTHYLNSQKHGEKGLQHKCYHVGSKCKCVCN